MHCVPSSRFVSILAGAIALSGGVRAQGLYDISKIKTFNITVTPSWRTVMASNFSSKTYIKANIEVDGETYRDVGVRHKGFSTYHFLPRGKTDKRPWKIAVDEFVAGQRIQGYRTLNFGNNVWDPSMVREVAGYEFMRKFLPAPKSCFARLVVNGEDLGIFAHTQQINKDFLQEHFESDQGNRYRGERASSRTPWNDSALRWLGTSVSRYQAAYELKTESGRYPPWTTLMQRINVLNNTLSSQLEVELPKVIDVDNFLRFIAVANITAWLDSYLGRTCKNFYLYEDHYHGQLALQPWDLNNGLGGLTDGLGATGVARIPPFFREGSTQYPRPAFTQLMRVAKWRARYLAHYRAMLAEFDQSKMLPRLNALRAFIRPALATDVKRLYTMAQFDTAMTRSLNLGFVTVPPLQPFVQNRTAYLSSHPDIQRTSPSIRGLRHTPLQPKSTETVWVNATIRGATIANATLHYRVRGPFVEARLFDDGQHNDGRAGDGIFGASIPAQSAFATVQYFVTANTDLATNGAMTVWPIGGAYRAHEYRVVRPVTTGPIVISEFLAKNETGLQDAAGERDDWIELTNVGSSTVTVGGMYLTDDVTEPTKWRIPSGQSLPPGGVLHVWADGQPAQGPLHASFKLSASGEECALFAADGTTNLDWIEFGPQVADVSTGRLPGDLARVYTLPEPTPTQANEPDPCGHMSYGAADPNAADFELVGSGQPKIGSNVQYGISRAPAAASGGLYLSLNATSLAIPQLGVLLLDPTTMLLVSPFRTDASGGATLTFPFPTLGTLVNRRFYLQAFVATGAGGRLANGVMLRTCR